MCGIAGFSGNFDQMLLEHMNVVQVHRGPDDSGIWFNKSKSVGLAHRRLSIIDLSTEAKQPMSNVQETITIVFNGEIYNYRELRKELQAKGYSFKNSSDTEVLLHLYEEFSYEMLNKLNGIF